MGTMPNLEIHAVLLHGIRQDGGLSMIYVRAGDEKRIGKDVIVLAVCFQSALAKRDIVDFKTPVSVAVGGNCPGKAFKNNIQCLNRGIIDRKMDIHICVESSHLITPLTYNIRMHYAVANRK